MTNENNNENNTYIDNSLIKRSNCRHNTIHMDWLWLTDGCLDDVLPFVIIRFILGMAEMVFVLYYACCVPKFLIKIIILYVFSVRRVLYLVNSFIIFFLVSLFCFPSTQLKKSEVFFVEWNTQPLLIYKKTTANEWLGNVSQYIL